MHLDSFVQGILWLGEG